MSRFRFFYVALMLITAPGRACEFEFGDPRRLPIEGEAKDGTADYKLHTKLLMELLAAARAGEKLPFDFRADVVPKAWSESPVSSVRLTGRFNSPHRLAHHPVRIFVHRTRAGVSVLVETIDERWTREILPGAFLDVFPWRRRHGLLGTLIISVLENRDLRDWTRIDSLDAPAPTR